MELRQSYPPNNIAAYRRAKIACHFERSKPTPFLAFTSCERVGLRREKSLFDRSYFWRLLSRLVIHAFLIVDAL
jgi:hypothetical protein